MALGSNSEAWLKRSHLEIFCFLMLPMITFFLVTCPHDLLSPPFKRGLEHTAHLHVGLTCYAWVQLSHAEFRHKLILLPWLLLPWLFDTPQYLPLLGHALLVTIIHERLSHGLKSKHWLIALIHLDLIWMVYRPFFFPKLPNLPLFFGSILAGEPEWARNQCLSFAVSMTILTLPPLAMIFWRRKKHAQF
jgi:hypothetical protein